MAGDGTSGEPPSMRRGAKRILAKPLTAPRAARLIAEFTLLTTLGAGVLAWLLDRADFPTLGTGLWWALQTVTTVGYGDVAPEHTEGRVIATLVMLAGIAFLAVVTASITATFVEDARRRLAVAEKEDLAPHLDRIASQLQSISARLDSLEEAVNGPDRGHGDA